VQNPVDIDFRDGTSGHAGEQNPAQGITQRVAKATLERLDNNTCFVIGLRLNPHGAGLQKIFSI
jgi:hypothetical protein